jgi:hypothetical protein
MARLTRLTLVTAFAMWLVACKSDHRGSPDASARPDSSAARADTGPDTATDGGVDCTPVATGGGWIGRACVHEVPSGSSVSSGDGGTTFVTLGGKVVATYGPCPCKVMNGNHIGPPELDAGQEGQEGNDSGLATTDGG